MLNSNLFSDLNYHERDISIVLNHIIDFDKTSKTLTEKKNK